MYVTDTGFNFHLSIAEFGNKSISTKTLNSFDLFETFYDFLNENYPTFDHNASYDELTDLYTELTWSERDNFSAPIIDNETKELIEYHVWDDTSDLQIILQSISPIGYTFGSHIGSSADIGYWPLSDYLEFDYLEYTELELVELSTRLNSAKLLNLLNCLHKNLVTHVHDASDLRTQIYLMAKNGKLLTEDITCPTYDDIISWSVSFKRFMTFQINGIKKDFNRWVDTNFFDDCHAGHEILNAMIMMQSDHNSQDDTLQNDIDNFLSLQRISEDCMYCEIEHDAYEYDCTCVTASEIQDVILVHSSLGEKLQKDGLMAFPLGSVWFYSATHFEQLREYFIDNFCVYYDWESE